uniref:Uncharacterized protein n=1 Tax=Meloidogyne hapla TaxID=6305 RepID=A0A1I8BQY6_MELHA
MKKLTEDAKQQIKVKNVKKKKEKIDKKQIKAIKIAESKPAVDKEVEKKVITEEKEAIEKETKVEIIKNVEESIKLDYFIDDKNMFSIFNEFTKGKHSITQRLINVGIYVNEIGERFEFLEKLKKHVDVFEIYFVNLEKFKRMENYWGKIKEELIFKNKHEENKKIENKLNYLLIEILKLSEGKTIFGRYNKEEISEKMKENLYLEKISKYFVDKDETISSLSKNQRQFVQNLLNLKKDVIDDKILKIQKRIGELKKIKEQIKLG